MQKLGIGIALWSMSVVLTPLFGQAKIGVRGGWNTSTVKWERKAVESEHIGGFHVGGTLEVMIPAVNVGAEASVLYVQERGERNEEKATRIKTKRMEIPVHGKWKIGVSGVKVYVVTGPRMFLPLSANVAELVEQAKMKHFGMGWDIGGGVELLGHLQGGVQCVLNLTDDYEAKLLDAEKVLGGKAWGWEVTLAYYF
jgi:hypothetical protein